MTMNQNGVISTVLFPSESPFDDDDNSIEGLVNTLKELGAPYGKHVQGNLGRSLFPVPSSSMSPDNNIHVVINKKGGMNHRTIGIAHEFGHVILFLRHQPHKHGTPDVDSFIYNRSSAMSKRLGYDY